MDEALSAIVELKLFGLNIPDIAIANHNLMLFAFLVIRSERNPSALP
jgi:hypothetical protein